MLPVQASNDDYQISGYISMPEVNRSSRNYMTTLVNGRVIKNTTLGRCINEAYTSFKEDTRYPIVVLDIKTDPTLIDVNVHPSKQDIKFSNFEELKQLIINMIRNAIKEKLLIPKIELPKEDESIKNYENITLNLEREVVADASSNDDYQNRLSNIINFNHQDEINDFEEDYIEEVSSPKNKLPELYPVGLALGTYIICENEKGIYLIDQHAAQERINYEKYSYYLSHPNQNSIKNLVPIIIELPTNEYFIIKKNIDIIRNMNIEIEEFGTNSYRITSHPTWFPRHNPDKVMRNIIDQIIKEEHKFNLAKFNDHLAATMACKASVKGNTRITIEDMESLINQLRNCENPFNCPHGRPTIIEFTIYELEKMFKRSL